jgi:hypothetical protein
LLKQELASELRMASPGFDDGDDNASVRVTIHPVGYHAVAGTKGIQESHPWALQGIEQSYSWMVLDRGCNR